MTTAIEEFVLYLEAEKGSSPRTGFAYRSDLCLLHHLLSARSELVGVEDISPATARSWMLEMKGRGLSSSTIARRIHALRSFWRFLQDTGVVEDDRLRKLSTPKRERKLPAYLRSEELRALLETARSHADPFVAARDYALMAVAVYTGVRRSELLRLRLGDVDIPGKLMVVRGKGGKWRAVPLAEEAASAVVEWLVLRRDACRHDVLFTTRLGNRIHPSQMQRIWRRLLTHSRIRTRLDTTAVYLRVASQSLQVAMQRHPLSMSDPSDCPRDGRERLSSFLMAHLCQGWRHPGYASG